MPAVIRVSAVYTMSDQVSSKLAKMATKVTALERSLGNATTKLDNLGNQAKNAVSPLGDVNKQLADMKKTLGTAKGSSGLIYRVDQLNGRLKSLGGGKNGHVIKVSTSGVKSSERDIIALQAKAAALTANNYKIKLEVDKGTVDLLKEQATALDRVAGSIKEVKLGFSALKQGEAELRKTMRGKTQAAENQRKVLSSVERQMTRNEKSMLAFKRAARDGSLESRSFTQRVLEMHKANLQADGSFFQSAKAASGFLRVLPLVAAGASVVGVAVGGLSVMLHGLIAPVLSVISTFKDMVGVVALLPAAYGAAAVAVGSFMGAMNSYFGDALTNAGKLNEIQKKLDTVTDAEQRKTLLEQQSKLLGEMNPKQQKLAQGASDLLKQWREMFTSNTKLQDRFFGTANRGISTASKLIKRFDTAILSTADQVRGLADTFFSIVDGNRDLNMGMMALFVIARGLVGTLRKALEPLLGFFGRVLQASVNPMARIAHAFELWALSLNRIDVTTIEHFIQRGIDSAAQWWDVVKNLAGAFNNIFRAGRQESADFLDMLQRITGEFENWTAGEGFSVIQREFQNGMKVAKALGRFVKEFVKQFMLLGADGEVGRGVVEFIDMLTGGLPRLFGFLESSLKNIGPSLTRFLDSLGEMTVVFEGMQWATKLALDVLTEVNNLLNKMPDPVQKLLGLFLGLSLLLGTLGSVFGPLVLIGGRFLGVVTKLGVALGGLKAGFAVLARGGTAMAALMAMTSATSMAGPMGGKGKGGKGGGGGMAGTAAWLGADMAMSGMGPGGAPRGARRGGAFGRGYGRARAQGAGRMAAASRGMNGLKMSMSGGRGMATLMTGLKGLGTVVTKLGPQMALLGGAVGAVTDYMADTGGTLSKMGSASKGFLRAIDVTRVLPGSGLSGLLPDSGADIARKEAESAANLDEFNRLQVELKSIVDRIADTKKQLEGIAKERNNVTRSVDLQNPEAQRGMTAFRVASGEDPVAAAAAVQKQAQQQLVQRVNATYHQLEGGVYKNVEDLASALKKHGHKNADGMAQRMWKQVIDDGLVNIKGKMVKPVADAEFQRLKGLQAQTTDYLQSQPGFEGITAPNPIDQKTGAPIVSQGQANKATQQRGDQAWLNKNMPDWKTVAADIKQTEANLNDLLKVDEQLLLDKMPALEAAGKAAGTAPMAAIKVAVKNAQPSVNAAIKKSGDDQKKTWTKTVTGSGGILPLLSGYSADIDKQITALGSGGGASTTNGFQPLPPGGMAATGPGGASPTAMAGGGRVVPGDPRRGDSVHTLLKPGEVVLNEGQQRKLGMASVTKALSGPGTAAKGTFGFGHNMQGASSSALKFASGGIVPELQPYYDAAVKLGATITSTTGGGHAANSQHYTGHAIDSDGGPAVNMKTYRAFEPDAKRGKVTELFFDPAGGYSGGRSIGAIGGHGDHVHTGIRGGAGGAAAIGGFGPPPKAKTPPNFGPTPIGRATQKRANEMLPAIQARLNAAHAAMMGGDGGHVDPNMPGSPKAIGQSMAAMKGWTGNEWSSLAELWTRESNWNPTAENKSSGAYGIPQALPASKLPAAGQKSGGSSASAQIGWGLNYIQERYGSPSKAVAFHDRMNWYGRGGEGLVTSPTTIGVGDKSEHVQITPTRTEANPGGAINSVANQGAARANVTNNFYIGVLTGDEKTMRQLADMVGNTIADQIEGAANSSVADSVDVMSGNG